ncbi:hypothetical protein LR48_Vigan06g098200 [Vigna angularis]|uniref:DUF8039 domain-containing protein n=1 Tax=Phaseolus angularis TaxID=3914 RepID=A0A0L9USH5_PHAAN|nr:hypothetical protein LR48_Vigan06g098200 [Vigna angularis]
MTQGTMGPPEAPTPPRVSTRGSCSTVEPTQYSGQYELLVDGDPPRIVAVRRVLEGGQTIHGVSILPHHVRVTIDEVRDPQAQVSVPTLESHFVGEAIGSFIAWPRALIMSHIATPHFTRPQKQPIHDTIIHEDDDMAEAEDDPLSKLMTRLPGNWGRHDVEYFHHSTVVHTKVGYEFVEPQTIQPFGNTLESKQHYLHTWMDKSKRDVYLVPYIDGSHWQLMVIIPKQCKIIWFCSVHKKMKTDLRTMLQGWFEFQQSIPRDPPVVVDAGILATDDAWLHYHHHVVRGVFIGRFPYDYVDGYLSWFKMISQNPLHIYPDISLSNLIYKGRKCIAQSLGALLGALSASFLAISLGYPK